ncbi:unnamed protein product [Caenorhabditis sp. 36 PRJEB53466]|nr:unnamed protein product [Caenorhabditis sp. 36 PRJEB53466]
MSISPIFWNDQQKCSVVFIAGVCSNQNEQESKASYGIYWGLHDERNKCGPVAGEQSQLRAELTGVKKRLWKWPFARI